MERRLSRNDLKWIACVTMLVDHIGCAFFAQSDTMTLVLRMLTGRIAYPLFCFLFAEGFLRTHHPWRHVRDLFLFGVVSELFFNKACFGSWFYPYGQNVMFSWMIGFLMLIFLGRMKQYYDKDVISLWEYRGISFVILLVAVLIANWLQVDYGFVGVLCMALAYVMVQQEKAPWLTVLSVSVVEAVFYATPGTLLAVPFAHCYDPEKPCMCNPVLKYGFYAFYPVHLALIALLRVLIGT